MHAGHAWDLFGMTAQRLDSIDQFRGAAIILMVLANYLAGVESVPAWLKHAPDVGFTVIDLVAPLFIFAIGLTYGGSLRKRVGRDGWRSTLAHFGRRFGILLALGLVLAAGEIALGFNPTGVPWGVLPAIAAASLLPLPLLQLPAAWRAACGLALLAGYQLLLDTYWLAVVLGSPHGGLPGALGWTAMLLLATALADLYHDTPRGRRAFLPAAMIVLAGGLALALLVPISKNRVSASYVLATTGASGLLFALFAWCANVRGLRLPWLSAWGRNPLALYVLHIVLLGVFVLPAIPDWYTAAPPWLVVVQATALLIVLGAIALALQRAGRTLVV